MARTTPVSNGCTSLVRPPGTILPVDVATISTLPNDAHASAMQNTATMLAPIARPTGEGGVSAISSAAGRNAISASRRRTSALGNATTFLLAGIMDARLQVVEFGIPPVRADQVVVVAILDDPAALDRDGGRLTHRRKPMGATNTVGRRRSVSVLLDGALAS